ncbi:arabinofuranan 3-O-arabinosyltransferase [Nocardioides terrae]|uniref:Arabinofuranan 3-O-arabinosyltransferase n=1 Tax=Nocardioides terrae TaxID=574651 RepID=A0A1I1G0C5_9ACTN|nr:alpha-(1->3)-arabinofuranosyltransferase family protein [Nocardioides terrae]SFC02640.1 arabinofuranan 3-O-arabinosyltransferase [Nocardioides terrae]
MSEGRATAPLRMWGYGALLTALAFSQSAGAMVADTKFDLVTNPGKFLANALHLWDPSAAFGQVQNQAYGYAWPMGPFFWLGHAAQMPGWVVQRLWWALLLCAAFFGVVRLAQRLAIGSPLTQVVAGFAFVLTPRMTTLIGGTSVEVWPMALAPWVLLPLVRGSREGSVRRAAALSALVVATCGGVNAVAVAAVLPLGVIWIVTRDRGPRRWRLLGWWTLFTALATLWWSLPLLLLGRYSAPFLDYIENAGITTVPTGLGRTLVGTSDWVAYFTGIDYTAGQTLVTSEHLLLDAAAIAAAGLVGVALHGNPERRFLGLSVLAGVALVGFGYSGQLAGFFADDRTALLDGVLAPLRNLHKFDVVLRLPLVLGLAHLLAELPRLIRGRGAGAALFGMRAATALALVALATPWLQDEVAPREGVAQVPAYWSQAADYLARTDDGTVSLVVPASAFGVYSWGNTHDDVMQGLADSPWAVRNVIPLAQPGNVVFLDAVTRYLESGHPPSEADGADRAFARFLAANGVGRLVVRNDVDRFETGAPDPAYVASLLGHTHGISLAESFGPTVGAPAVKPEPDGGAGRIIEGDGISAEVGSIEVYSVDGAATAYLTTGAKAAAADPGSTLAPAVQRMGGGQLLLAADAERAGRSLLADGDGQVLTDDMRRRETNFASVRWNESATMPAERDYQLGGPEHEHRVVADQARWQTTEQWSFGVSDVTASSSEGSVSALPPIRIGDHPGAAIDGDPTTAWRSARQLDPTGQVWQMSFTEPVDLSTVRVTLAADSAPVDQLQLWAGDESVLRPAPEPGQTRTYSTKLGFGDLLRIVAAGRDLSLPGSLAISEVEVPGLEPLRLLRLPKPLPDVPVDLVSLTRDPDRAACTSIGDALPCSPTLQAAGEDGDTLARAFETTSGDDYDLTATASLRRGVDDLPISATVMRATSSAGPAYDVAAGPTAMLDGDPGTTWVAADRDDTVTITFPHPTRLTSLVATTSDDAAAARPTVLRLTAGRRRTVVELDADGVAQLPDWRRVRSLRLEVASSEPAVHVVGSRFEDAMPGISSLTFGGLDDARAEAVASTEPRSFGCGSGPQILVDRTSLRTAVTASVRDLVRGRQVGLSVCGDVPDDLLSGTGAHTVIAPPSALFRVDTVTLERQGAAPARTATLTTERDGRGAPISVALPERSGSSVLTLPQNVNDAWRATLDGRTLTPIRTDGWKQAWLVPAGAAGTVRLSVPAARSFTWALVAGGVGLLGCVLVVLLPVPRRRAEQTDLPPLGRRRAGLLEVAVIAVVLGLVGGWWGLGVAVLVVLAGPLLRARVGWPWLAGLALWGSGLGLSWDRITERSWAVEWTQGWALAAVGLLAAALLWSPARQD